MKNKYLALIIALFTCYSASVFSSTQNFLMWQLPSTGISLPVYVYENKKQLSYIPSNSLQYFAGKYTAGKTNATYNLYYQDAKNNWHGCVFRLMKGSVDNSVTNACTGAVINPPVTQNGATSNVYTAAFAAEAWPSATPPKKPAPKANSYKNRTITLTNNTEYPFIQVGESCSVKVGANKAPSCQNNPIIATIAMGDSHAVTVGHNGLNSAAFYLSSYCKATKASDCATKPTAAQCANGNPPSNWVCTGGYFAGQVPYATKIEPTVLSVAKGVPEGASNIDVSAVDGYSMGVRLYPAPGEYCTFTIPPENSNVLGAGYYNADSPLAQVNPTSDTALETLCGNSSQLPASYSGKEQAWNLKETNADGDFEGCMSPCTYATQNSPADAPKFCCTGSYDTPATCDVDASVIGANTSTYNTNLLSSSAFQNVYGFAYGDAGSDYACPPETNFVVEFISSAAKKKK